MESQTLRDTARALFGRHKGCLQWMKSNGTCNKRFASLGIPQTIETRRSYRELIVTTTGLGECIGGAILYDETFVSRQATVRPLSKSSLTRESFLESKLMPAPRIWQDIQVKK